MCVARGAWFSEVCSGREHRETSDEQVGQVQNDEHLCLIAVIGMERPDKRATDEHGSQRETGRRLMCTDWSRNWRNPYNCVIVGAEILVKCAERATFVL